VLSKIYRLWFRYEYQDLKDEELGKLEDFEEWIEKIKK
jgi:hypothetical protein